MNLAEIKQTLERWKILTPIQFFYENIPGLQWAIRSYFLRVKSPDFKPLTPRSMRIMEDIYNRFSGEWKNQGGDYLEFGVYAGYSLWYSQKQALEHNLEKVRYFGFDSFKGLPEPEGIDRKGKFREGDYKVSRDVVEKNLRKHNVDWNRTYLIEGYYEDTLNKSLKQNYDLTSAHLIFVDCDLYRSTVPVLEFCRDLLQNGTVILFDDWEDFGKNNEYGERKAWNEFTRQNSSFGYKKLDYPEWFGAAFRITDLNG